MSVGQAGSKDVLKQGKKVSLGPRTCGTKLYNFESILETHRVNDPRVPGQADSPPPYALFQRPCLLKITLPLVNWKAIGC